MNSNRRFLLLLLRTAVTLAASLPATAFREQKFAMEPQDQTAVVGSKVTLPCRVVDKSGVLQWTKDDFGLGTQRNLSGYDRYSMIGSDEEGDFSLQIDPVMLEDDARYQCQVSPGPQGQPGIRSSFANVTVLVPPEAPRIVQGDYLVTTEDREIELECVSYGGKPAAEITWIDGHGNVMKQAESIVEKLPDTKRSTTKSILKLTPKKEHHNTTFTCQAQNTAERTHRSAKLKLEVKYAPKVTVSILSGASANGRIPEGSEVRIGCTADANPPEVTYKWFMNDELYVGDYTTELVIHNATRKHHDVIIKCEVHNVVGKSEESETLDITYGPQFRTKPKSVQADLRNDVTLTCDVDGNPHPDIKWIYEKTGRLMGTGPNLRVKVSEDNAGRYYCKATVPGYSEISADASIYLKGKPSIISHRTQYGVEGDTVHVECTAFSIPAPKHVVWTFNGKEIDPADQDFSVLEDRLPDGIKSTLIVRDSQEKHFGSYNCSVVNPYGSDVVEISLMPQKNFPLLLVVTSIVGAIIVVVIIIMIIFLCIRQNKKQPETDANTIEKQCKESDRSSNISDLKLDLRTGSSVSNVHCELDYIPGAESETGSESVITRIGVPLAGPVNVPGQDVYRYSAEYTEPTFPPKSDGQNNNGYVPYVDYSRDYNPPPMMQSAIQPTDSNREALQSTRLHLNSLQHQQQQQPHHSVPVSAGGGQAMPLNDLSDIHLMQQTIPNGGISTSLGLVGGIDPRYSAAYGNPYLRSSNVGLPAPSTAVPAATPAPPPYSRDSSRNLISVSSAGGGIVTAIGPNGAVPQVARLPNSPTSQYIVPNASLATIKRGTLATHV